MSDAALTVFPDLSLVDDSGRPVDTAALLGSRRTVVFFLRAATCPVCLGHSRRLLTARAEGRLTAPVVLVTPGGAAEAAAVARRVGMRDGAGPGVTVVASGNAHDAAGLPRQLLLQHSGTFVVDADRRVSYARTAAMPPRSFSEPELLRALADDRPSAA